MSKQKKLTVAAFVLMILTSVFGVTNIGVGFYRMGYAAIPMFIIGGLFYFIPYLFMMIELGTGFSESEGGIYTWMKETVSARFAFYGIFMWYASYVIWMFGKALNIWTPLSVAVLGRDVTANLDVASTFVLTALAIALIVAISILITKGAGKFAKIAGIGGLAVIALNVILILGGIIVFMLNGFQLQETLSIATLTSSPNPDFQSAVPFLGFMVFAVFAYGGTEAMAGIGDDLENPERDLKRGIFIAGAFIVICYVIGFLMVGAIMPWSAFPSEGVNSLSALYLIMQNLGTSVGTALGGDGVFLGNLLMRFSGLGMFFSFLGALITLMYSPLKQLIEATPKEYWPASFQEKNNEGILVGAIKAQAIIVIAFLAVKALGTAVAPESATKLFDLIVTMTNIAMTLPYMFLIWAWFKFRTGDFKTNIVLINDGFMVKFCLITTMFLVLFGNVFTIADPFMSGDIQTGIWSIAGPVIFIIIATVLAKRGE